MKIIDKIKSLFRRQPLTEADLAARAEAELMRGQAAANISARRGGGA
jgi:hypothetical protein